MTPAAAAAAGAPALDAVLPLRRRDGGITAVPASAPRLRRRRWPAIVVVVGTRSFWPQRSHRKVVAGSRPSSRCRIPHADTRAGCHQASPASRAATDTRTSASSVAAAAPSSSSSRARPTPLPRSGARSATTSAAAAFSATIADRPGRPRERPVHGLGVARSVTTRQRAHLGDRDAEVGGVDVVDADVAVVQLVDGRGRGDGELVEAVVPVEHECTLDAECSERAHDTLGHRGVGDTDRPTVGAHGVARAGRGS